MDCRLRPGRCRPAVVRRRLVLPLVRLALPMVTLLRAVSGLSAVLPPRLLLPAVPSRIAACRRITVLSAWLLLSLARPGVTRRRSTMRSRLETRHNVLLDAPADQALDRSEERLVLATDQRNRLAR